MRIICASDRRGGRPLVVARRGAATRMSSGRRRESSRDVARRGDAARRGSWTTAARRPVGAPFAPIGARRLAARLGARRRATCGARSLGRRRTSSASRRSRCRARFAVAVAPGSADRAARAAARARRLLRAGRPLSAAVDAADDRRAGARRRRARDRRRLSAARAGRAGRGARGRRDRAVRDRRRAGHRRAGLRHARRSRAWTRSSGPGNAWVAAAKALVSRDCAIDLHAGPSEIVDLRRTAAAPDWIAADLIAQAEHDPAARAILVTTKAALAREVVAAKSSARCRRRARRRVSIATERRHRRRRESQRRPSAIVNRLAPEHLVVDDARPTRTSYRTAGTIFVGRWSAQAAGDYCTGSNHVLPTGGAGRFRGGLSAADFVRVFTVQTLTRTGIRGIGPVGRHAGRGRGPGGARSSRCGCGCDELSIGVACRRPAAALQREHRRLLARRARRAPRDDAAGRRPLSRRQPASPSASSSGSACRQGGCSSPTASTKASRWSRSAAFCTASAAGRHG